MSELTQDQLSHISEIVSTYSSDTDDPTSLEVLLVLQEVCHILEISHYEMVSIFGKRTLHTLRTWGNDHRENGSTASPRRVWIWWPGSPRPALCKLLDDGTVARMTHAESEPIS
jgi:hypothetical protein